MSFIRISASLLVISLCCFEGIRADSTGTLLSLFCQKNANFTNPSEYASNWRTLLSVLSSSNSTSDGFNTTIVGQGSDRVYGLFMCRADLSTDECHDCAVAAVNESSKLCPYQKEAAQWYDKCMLRYSPRNILSRSEVEPPYSYKSHQSISGEQSKSFNELIMSAMNETKFMASIRPEKFAVKAINYTLKIGNFPSYETILFYSQCTADLSQKDCNSCLQDAVDWLPKCCKGRLGARLLLPSCNIRFELYNFLDGKNANATLSSPGSNTNGTASPGTPGPKPKGEEGHSKVAIIVVPLVFACAVVAFIGYCLLARRQRRQRESNLKDDRGNNITTMESLQFDFKTVKNATNDFSDDNKLGAGGFGVVFKGKLPGGQEIAVKRLSQCSEGGIEDFKNEVYVVAKLQHKNLVRLLGFCLEGEEKILIFEYVPNKSLDYFLFDNGKQEKLGWLKRYEITVGIVRGILYLHQDSRLTIIHRDLKTSNILLDSDLNPKISDFGMAKISGINQDQGSTSRIVGTYGYMSPEYAMYGHFSVKSDVYSFGVLLLEIISGRKNNDFSGCNEARDLVNYAWRLWKEGSALKLLDPALGETYQRNEVIRCIHIGLLCVQEDPYDRPAVAVISHMLGNHSITLPEPKQPGFYLRTNGVNSHSFTTVPSSVAELSISDFQPR